MSISPKWERASLLKTKSAWQSGWDNKPQTIASAQWDWLSPRRSLTQRLETLAPDIQLALLTAGWQDRLPEEEACLSTIFSPIERSWIREISWRQGGIDWIWAKTIIPENTQRPLPTHWKHCGEHSIGKLIFSDPNWRRTQHATAKLDAQHPYLKRINATRLDPIASALARRSCLHTEKHTALVVEVFLPEFWMEQCSSTT